MKLLTKTLMIATAIAPSLWAMTQTPLQRALDTDDVVLDTVGFTRPKLNIDPNAKLPSLTAAEGEKLTYVTHLLARTYGDSVVLRWAYDNYALWQVAKYGNVDIIRIDETNGRGENDTIARNIRAFTLAEMEKAFSPTDSLAGMAAQAMYGKAPTMENIKDDGFGYNPIAAVYEQQQTLYAYALLTAEWRADIANALGLRYTDRTALPGHKYRYAIQPNLSDSLRDVMPGVTVVVNEPFVPEQFNAELTDTVYPNGQMIRLMWPLDSRFSAYDIERRFNGGKWVKLNNAPSMTLATNGIEPDNNYFTDTDVDTTGVFEYRVRGYDSFGDKSNWSGVHAVAQTDNTPPMPPRISLFEVHREGKNKERAFVTIHWEKETIEPDMVGYNIYYYHDKNGATWTRLNDKLLAPTDTAFTSEVVALAGGFVSVSTVDNKGNEGASIPMEIDMEDFTPPAKPTGMKHLMLPSGVVILRWDDNKEPDLKGYMVYTANDTTHNFLPLSKSVQRDTVAFDTLKVKNVNQRYIYYRVKAIDYAGNSSPMSDIYQVTRANFDKPNRCVADTFWVNDQAININWRTDASHTVKEYRLYRKQLDDKNWVVVSTYDADSVKDYVLHTVDAPPFSRKSKYYYELQAVGLMGVTGDMSLPLGIWHKGPRFIDAKLELKGTVNKNGYAQLDWTCSDDVPEGYYFQIETPSESGGWRKLITLDSSARHNSRFYIESGEQRSFRIIMRWDDGLASKPSETVTLKYAPSATDAAGATQK